jgi:L-lactate dehydrogenase complex protein LldG
VETRVVEIPIYCIRSKLMSSNGQDEFIRNVRDALGHSQVDNRDRSHLFFGKGKEKGERDLVQIRAQSREAKLKLLDKLIEEGKPLNLPVIPMKDEASTTSAIVQLIHEKEPEETPRKSIIMWKHPLIERLNLSKALKGANIPVYTTDLGEAVEDPKKLSDRRQQIRRELIDSYTGITSADFCIADGAALVMKTRAGQARGVSLVPLIHIAVITLDQIISDLSELYTLLKYDEKERQEGLTNCMTLISGPSKTGDIELVMIHGAHGPRELYIYVITGQ